MALASDRVWAEMRREADHFRMLPEVAFEIARKALRTLREGEIKASDAKMLITEILEFHGANPSVLIKGATKPTGNPEMIEQGRKTLESALCNAYTREADELMTEIEAGKRARSRTVDLTLIDTKLNQAEANIRGLDEEARLHAAKKISELRSKTQKLTRDTGAGRPGGGASPGSAGR
jgi:hypothetical protein